MDLSHCERAVKMAHYTLMAGRAGLSQNQGLSIGKFWV